MKLSFLSKFVDKDKIVLRPDHPLLLRGPDALIGGQNNLCAVFRPHKIEIENTAHLASRLISLRLALPRHCRTMLIIDPDQEEKFKVMHSDFGVITTQKDKGIGRFLQNGQDFGNSRIMEKRIQSLAVMDFDRSVKIAQSAYRSANSRQRTRADAGSEFRSYRRTSERIQSGVFVYNPQNRIIINSKWASIVESRDANAIIRHLNMAISGQYLHNYILDRGIPHPQSRRTSILIAKYGEHLFAKRSKAIYASSFSGTAVIPSIDEEIINYAIELVSEQ